MGKKSVNCKGLMFLKYGKLWPANGYMVHATQWQPSDHQLPCVATCLVVLYCSQIWYTLHRLSMNDTSTMLRAKVKVITPHKVQADNVH